MAIKGKENVTRTENYKNAQWKRRKHVQTLESTTVCVVPNRDGRRWYEYMCTNEQHFKCASNSKIHVYLANKIISKRREWIEEWIDGVLSKSSNLPATDCIENPTGKHVHRLRHMQRGPMGQKFGINYCTERFHSLWITTWHVDYHDKFSLAMDIAEGEIQNTASKQYAPPTTLTAIKQNQN